MKEQETTPSSNLQCRSYNYKERFEYPFISDDSTASIIRQFQISSFHVMRYAMECLSFTYEYEYDDGSVRFG